MFFPPNLSLWDSSADHEGGSQASPLRLWIAVEGQCTWEFITVYFRELGICQMLLLQWVTLGKVKMRPLLSAAFPVSATMAESSSEWPINSLDETRKQNHVIQPGRSRQLNLLSTWVNSSCYLFSRFFHSVQVQDPYFASGAMARAFWFITRTRQLSNHYQHEQWATTSRCLWNCIYSLGEGYNWRVNLLQSTEVEFLTLPCEA